MKPDGSHGTVDQPGQTDPPGHPTRRPDLAGLATYSSVTAEAVPIIVRASSNEAPGPTPEPIRRAVCEALSDAGRYPLIGGRDLVGRLAEELQVPWGRVAVGDGALTLLDRILLAHVRPGDEVVLAWRSYEAYPISARVAGATPVLVPLDEQGGHDLPAMLDRITPATRVLIVCDPNNPTGIAVDPQALLDFLDRVPSEVLVVLDQAYVEYDETRHPHELRPARLSERPNVVVLRTFSKAHALAGLRVGYLVAADPIVASVSAVLPPFPVSTPAIAAAMASLDHPEIVRDRVAATRAERDRLCRTLTEFGLPHLPSRANFVWLPLEDAAAAFGKLCAGYGVLVRPFAGEGVRITVGDPGLVPALEPLLTALRSTR